MKKIVLIVVLLVFNFSLKAQVGIGNAVPNANSILDLTNATNGKALILPQPTSVPNSTGNFDTEAMVFYYQDNIYVRTSTGINVLSPWSFDGTNANGVFTPSGMPVGVGVTPPLSANVNLQVGNSGDVTVSSSNAAMAVGNLSNKHLLIDNDEILAKTNPTTAGTLKLQEDGGTVSIRSGAAVTTSTVLTANGSIDAAGSGKILQNGLDLVPPGTVVMWSGSVDGSGYPLMGVTPNTNWIICDGNNSTPDLRERFVVGAGGDNLSVPGGAYAVSNTGGEVTHALTVAEMPAHNHPGGTTNSTGAHTHSTGSIPNGGEGYVGAYNGNNEVYKWGSTGSVTSSSDGTHSHTLNVASEGSGTAHENRPPYYALIFIMKL